MTVKPYGQKEALVILEPTGFQDEWTIDDQGQGLTSNEGLLALPFPFDGRDLAAFMLKDSGSAVAHFYGVGDSGLDESRLRKIGLGTAKRAVREAFEAYRDAVTKVGKWDADALARREAAHKAYWNSNNDQTLLKAFEDAQAEWDDAHGKWLTAMVKALLETKAQAAPEPTHAAPAPVMAGASDEVKRVREKRLTWRDVSIHYIVKVMHSEQCTTGKSLFRALEAKAGPDSPFDKGTGDNRGSLFVREVAQSISLKTIQNEWKSLCKLAQR